MKLIPVIFKRQLGCYLSTPATYLNVALFLALSMAGGVHINQWPGQEIVDLGAFVQLHPWLHLLLIPALATQLWSDESNAGFIELLPTLPITTAELSIGKFLAAWCVAGMALSLMFPVVIAINYLGNADNGVIASQLTASWLLAGSYLSIGGFICTLTRHRIVIFVLTLGLLLIASGLSYVVDALEHQLPIQVLESLSALSPFSRFALIDNGQYLLHDSLYFISVIFAFLTATTVTLNSKYR